MTSLLSQQGNLATTKSPGTKGSIGKSQSNPMNTNSGKTSEATEASSNPPTTLTTTIVTIDHPFGKTSTVPSTTEFEDYEYPAQDIPTRKPYFPLDGLAKPVQKKDPRFEKAPDGQVRKKAEKVFNELASNLNKTLIASGQGLDVHDLSYGSAGADGQGCSCSCEEKLEKPAAATKPFQMRHQPSPMVVKVVQDSKKSDQTTYFPVVSEGGHGQSQNFGATNQPDFNEAADFSLDPPKFFQVKLFVSWH